ncbi:hypothetical protein HTSR_1729 [Halodesulfurarchaeum formicicum]|uniref:Uncharacterized protein n=1 Tax=Halodesulfurarchaeum formicicum TaxID=1873524 RepID=A0A1D8S6D9_9EURY|nr:hypothetical protein [Halodesulfurarchaeum formicicum]AOW80899.1 hypothetical protein HTSR_1729 [Halodesulfurarchaeum formicicum]
MVKAQHGEQLVGAYHKLITDCEIVSYNQRSKEQGDQMEIDVLAINSEPDTQEVYICEVITHLHGMRYSGSPDTDEWTDYGNEMYQHTLERVLSKFYSDHGYATRVFDDAENYVFELWSPVVPEGGLTDGLAELERRFESTTEQSLDLVINQTYSKRIDELRSLAADEKKAYGEPAFRFLQILEHMRR